MMPRLVLMSGCLALGLLATFSIASAKEETSTCETLAGALSGAEKDNFLKKCEETFRTGHVCTALNSCCKNGSQNCCDTARIERCNQ
jgi:hypothetical protein